MSANEDFFRSKKAAAEHKHGSLSDADRKVAERLDRFLGGSWWRQHFAKVTDQDDERRATDIALQVWQEYEKKLTANSRYRAVRMPVRPRPDLVPKYVLALFTTHSEGAWHFADSLGKAGVEWQQAWQEERWRRTGPDAPTLFDDALVFDARKYVADNAPGWIALIRQNLARLLDEGHPFKPADRVPDVYGSTLGQASATHVGSAIKEMHASGLVANTGTGDFWRTSLRRP